MTTEVLNLFPLRSESNLLQTNSPPEYVFFCTCYSGVRRVRSCAIQGMDSGPIRGRTSTSHGLLHHEVKEKYMGIVVSKAASFGLGQYSIPQVAECFRCRIMPGCLAHLTCSTGTKRFGERGVEHPQCEARLCGKIENNVTKGLRLESSRSA